MSLVLQIFVILLKFIVPALMLKYPFIASWVNYFLDVIDGDILLSLGMSDGTYQLIDKSADYISYVFMLIVGWRWSIKRTIIILFIYRTIGQILFFITGNELVFFYFQNFLEPLFMIYALILFKQKSEKAAYQTYRKYLIFIWVVILVYKVWNEWYLHFANIDLSLIIFGFTGGR